MMQISLSVLSLTVFTRVGDLSSLNFSRVWSPSNGRFGRVALRPVTRDSHAPGALWPCSVLELAGEYALTLPSPATAYCTARNVRQKVRSGPQGQVCVTVPSRFFFLRRAVRARCGPDNSRNKNYCAQLLILQSVVVPTFEMGEENSSYGSQHAVSLWFWLRRLPACVR